MLERDGYRLATFDVAHGVPALGWSLIESTRPGRFDVAGPMRSACRTGPSAARSSEESR